MSLGFEELDRFAMPANHFIYEFAIKVRSGKRCQAIRNALMFRRKRNVSTALYCISGRSVGGAAWARSSRRTGLARHPCLVQRSEERRVGKECVCVVWSS